MERRAGPLLANRSLSALIVVSFVLSAFAGLYIVASPQPSAAQVPIGDLTITSGTYTIENIEQPVDGDVVVSGGELIVRNGALMIISTVGDARHVTVSGTGTLILEHGVLTSYLNQINPWPFLTLTIDGGTVIATDSSILSFPGFIYIQNDGELILRDSSIEQIPDEDLAQYLGGSEDVSMDSADDGPTIMINGATLMMFDSSITDMPEFPTDMNVASNLTVSDVSTLLAVNSYIDVDFGPAVAAGDWYLHNVLVVEGLSNAYLYGCHFEPYSGELSARAQPISTTVDSDVYIYRWLNVIVGDEYGVPIPDAGIDALFTGSTELEGEPLVYYTPAGESPTPPTEVLNYMGETTGSIFVTKSDGVALIPFLTDIVTLDESGYVGSFEITGSTIIDAVPYSSTETFSFPAYPAMTSEDQQFEVTVDIEGVSAESPDSSRWLVVPPDLVIEDMTYYHAGDVIVASDGTLTLRNAVFRVVQSVPNEFTIYVDGTANFVIESSELVSALPLNLIVKGEGTLEVRDSILTGINIEVMENAEVILDGTSVDGTITTSWDSEAHIVIQDSDLTQSIALSGSAVCEITDTNVPSVVVEDGATALIYRWITVTVFDGGDYPLEDAVVSASFFVNQTFWVSETTDSSGVARLNSLGTILTSTGSTYVGQYQINSSYWSDGVEHFSDTELNVSVQPYTEPLTDNATYAYLTMSTVLLPDLSVTPEEFWTDPVEVVYNTSCSVAVRVWNFGEDIAENTLVEFYNGTTEATAELIGTYTVVSISPGSWDEAYVTWTPMITGSQTLWVEVNDPAAFDERTFDNNYANIPVTVLGPADLEITSIEFYLTGTGLPQTSIPGGMDITVRAELRNSGEATVSGVYVTMTVSYGDDSESFDKLVMDVMMQNYEVIVQFTYTLPIVTDDTEMYFDVEADPDGLITETEEDDNTASATLLVTDIREDLKIAVEDVSIDYESGDSCIFGDTVKIIANVFNLGGTDVDNATIEFGSSLWTDPIATVNEAFPAGTSKAVSIDFHVNITTGNSYDIYVLADSEYVYSEKNETNNMAEVTLVVEQLTVDITFAEMADEYQAEDMLIVYATVTYADDSNVTVAGLSGLSIELVDEAGETVIASGQMTTNDDGMASLTLTIPEKIESGTYTVLCTIVGMSETQETTVEIQGIVSGGGIPLLVWIIVIAIIAAVVIGFTVYTYVYGLGKLVECGECGEFIPASNKRCPKCGVEFEVGTMKCSECGAWVPAESAECPNCGVKFVGEEVDEGDYLDKMRKEYDEMVSKYRELAKGELGKKFSDKKFDEWWVAQPTYISFDDWLAKEEEKRKEGPVACPVCGTLNPKEATVCNKCGTVFGAAEEASEDEGSPPQPPMSGQQPAQQQPAQPAQQPPQQAAPKMVIRRPIDRKVVPKKVIRTPINKDGSGGEGNEGSEGQ